MQGTGCLNRWWRGHWRSSPKTHAVTPAPYDAKHSCWWDRNICIHEQDARAAPWEWAADDPSCALPPPQALTVEALCKAGKSLLLVGDSLTYQVFIALLSELSRQSGFRGREDRDGETCEAPRSCEVLPCGVRICFRNAYFLTDQTVTLHDKRGNAVGTCCHACHVHRKGEPSGCPPWSDAGIVERVPISTDVEGWRREIAGFGAVIFNLAAHWAGKRSCPITIEHPSAEPSLLSAHNRTLDTLLQTLEAARGGSRTPTLWWRTQPAGDAGCETPLGVSRPLHASLLAKVTTCRPFAGVWGKGTRVHDTFGWRYIPRLNANAAHLFARRGHNVLYADAPYMLRADAHIASNDPLVLRHLANATWPDCLHHCIPGPPRMMALAIARLVLGI